MRICYVFVVVLAALVLTGCGEKIEANMSGEVPDFEFTTQDGDQLGLGDLEGEWWIANFMYTNCETICPVMTVNMKKIQDSLKEAGMPVRIISFTVDPDYDTPEILKTYATEQQADLSSWSFLTGYEFEAVRKLSVDGFKVALQQASPGTGNDQIVHGTNFYLISPKGEIVKKYDGVGAGGKEQLMADLQKVH